GACVWMIVLPAAMHSSASAACASTVAGTCGLRRGLVTPLSATSIITGLLTVASPVARELAHDANELPRATPLLDDLVALDAPDLDVVEGDALAGRRDAEEFAGVRAGRARVVHHAVAVGDERDLFLHHIRKGRVAAPRLHLLPRRREVGGVGVRPVVRRVEARGGGRDVAHVECVDEALR